MYPVSIVEEDNHGRIPFTEVQIDWIQARRAVRLLSTALKKENARKNRISTIVQSFATTLTKLRTNTDDKVYNPYSDDEEDLAAYAVVDYSDTDSEEEEGGEPRISVAKFRSSTKHGKERQKGKTRKKDIKNA